MVRGRARFVAYRLSETAGALIHRKDRAPQSDTHRRSGFRSGRDRRAHPYDPRAVSRAHIPFTRHIESIFRLLRRLTSRSANGHRTDLRMRKDFREYSA